jgi:hypothetical protein
LCGCAETIIPFIPFFSSFSLIELMYCFRQVFIFSSSAIARPVRRRNQGVSQGWRRGKPPIFLMHPLPLALGLRSSWID